LLVFEYSWIIRLHHSAAILKLLLTADSSALCVLCFSKLALMADFNLAIHVSNAAIHSAKSFSRLMSVSFSRVFVPPSLQAASTYRSLNQVHRQVYWDIQKSLNLFIC